MNDAVVAILAGLRAVRSYPHRSRLCLRRNRTLFTMVPDGTHIREAKGVMPDGAIAWDPVA